MQTLFGVLLRKTPLANDDLLLEMLTPEGKKTLFAPRAQKSKQMRAELDYFRLLEVSLSPSRRHGGAPKVRSVRTRCVFSSFSQSWALFEQGVRWTNLLRQNIAENDPLFDLFPVVTLLLKEATPEKAPRLDFYLRMKIIEHFGQVPLSQNPLFQQILTSQPTKALHLLEKLSEKTFKAFEDYLKQLVSFLEAKGIHLHDFSAMQVNFVH